MLDAFQPSSSHKKCTVDHLMVPNTECQRRNEAIFHLDHCEIKTSTLKCQTLPGSDLLGISLTRVSET